MPVVAVTSAALDMQALTAEISADARGEGAIATFAGLVRDHNQGRRVRFLEYEAYEPLALRALERIVAEAKEAWPGIRLGLHHRTGRLEIGEASIIIVPIWKHEHFEGGEIWLEGATADPDDQTARQAAYRIACA
jgi:molybdopterin synthase catalytic subunit